MNGPFPYHDKPMEMGISPISSPQAGGYVQWLGDGFQEVKQTKGNWAGPIEPPEEA